MRKMICNEIWGNEYPSLFKVIMVNFSPCIVSILCGTFYPNVALVIAYTGAICGFLSI